MGMDFVVPSRQHRLIPSPIPLSYRYPRNLEGLHRILVALYERYPGPAGIEQFSMLLEIGFGFPTEQARNYSTCVLTQNSEASADCVSRNAHKLIGKWSDGGVANSGRETLVTRTESWRFKDDLNYRNKEESASTFFPLFGDSYSRSESSSNDGLWAPSDHPNSHFRYSQ